MKRILKHVHHSPSASFTELVDRHLEEISRCLPIDEARVVVERRPEASPAFRISVHLVTPGPDLFAEAMDHTLRAALMKTVGEIEARLDYRRRKRAGRLKRPSRTGLSAQLGFAGGRN